mmetsp:Transcript_7018/g.15975  ORF Transcript_7018/g.15975 Transcript_7018/m.15975 type:complete len:492 (+) Transcript_7018:152-1627(+)
MSAMELFRSRVAESAKAAAGAAKQLSSLDDMAQNDDYIQSEGLRVSDKKEYTSSASSFSENNSEMPSVVEDLSGKFVDALSTAARKHSRPRPVHEKNPRTSPDHRGRQSTTVDVARKQMRKSKEDINPSKTGPHRPKSTTQKPQLMSSVAALYDQNKQKNASKQSATRDENQKQPLMRKKTHHNREERGDKYSASKINQSPRSLATIPSSPGQQTNVLLVNEHHAHILHELDYDSDTDSSDDEQPRKRQNDSSGSDIEMGILGNAALHDQLEQELEESISRQNSLNGPTNDNKEKDVHRFMRITADLESEREVLLKSLETVPESTPTNNADRAGKPSVSWAQGTHRGSAGEETNKALRAGLSWVRNVASPQLEALSKQIMTKVSEADVSKKSSPEQQRAWRGGPMIGSRHPPPTGNGVEEEKITVSTSASFLADEDMAELERIRMRNSTSKLKALLQICVGNPRLAFIAVTLIFALFAYFYSRHRSVNDVF